MSSITTNQGIETFMSSLQQKSIEIAERMEVDVPTLQPAGDILRNVIVNFHFRIKSTSTVEDKAGEAYRQIIDKHYATPYPGAVCLDLDKNNAEQQITLYVNGAYPMLLTV